MKKLLLFLSMILCIGFVANAQTTIYEQDFDALNIGEGLAAQLDEWTTWSDAPGGAEDGVISDEQSVSGSQSLMISGTNDQIYPLGLKTSGKYSINFKYFVAEGSGGYYNIEHTFGSEWAFEIYFNNDGTGLLKANAEEIDFTFTNGTWLDIQNYIDINGNAIITIDGTEIYTWPYNTLAQGETVETPRLDVVNFYAGTSEGANYDPMYFVDDFEYIMIESGVSPAAIAVDQTQVDAENNEDILITINNIGEEPLKYSAYPVYPQNGKENNSSNDENNQTFVMSHSLNNNIDVNIQETNNKFTPIIERDATLTHIQAAFNGGFGFGSETDAIMATVFRPQDLRNYIGMKISNVRIALNELPAPNSTNMMIWERGGYIIPKPGNLLEEKPFTPIEATEVSISVDEDIYIDGKDLWVGYSATDLGEENFPFGLDAGPQIPNVNYESHGPGWVTINDTDDFGNLFILVDLTGTPSPNYISVTPSEGTISPGDNSQIMVSFDTNGLINGVYESELHIASNDIDNEFLVIPIEFRVSIGTNDLDKIGLMTFPNPTTDKINVQSNYAMKTIKVISQSGQVVSIHQANGKLNEAIDATNLESGVYLLQIELINKEILTNKVIIK